MNIALLIGNDINNINYNNNSITWDSLLKEINKICENNVRISKEKPFPLIYEEMYLKCIKNNGIKESKLKSDIAEIVKKIKPNEIHKKLINLEIENYITTNYDYALEKVLKPKDIDKIKNYGSETKYNIFRHTVIENIENEKKRSIEKKKFWHIHGECNVPNSITLGFEFYGGQIQHFRNYIVNGTKYKNKEIDNNPLHKRIKNNKNNIKKQSWIDLMYVDEIHILGLGLGFEEIDLWWLLTDRARFLNEKNKNIKKNKIIYYSPRKYKDKNKEKEEIMQAYDIEIVYIEEKNKLKYYENIIEKIENVLK